MSTQRNARKKARGNTVIPFNSVNTFQTKKPTESKRKRTVVWMDPMDEDYPGPPDAFIETTESNAIKRKGPNVADLKAQNRTVHSVKGPRYDAEQKRGLRGKNQYRLKIQELFAFINDFHPQVFARLAYNFDNKIKNGSISNVEEMEAFYKKCEELAECLKIFLEKAQYDENFKASSEHLVEDLFMEGFSVETRAEYEERFDGYFDDSEEASKDS